MKSKVAALLIVIFMCISATGIYGAACSHKWVYQKTVTSTCQLKGYVEYKCSKCGAIRRDELTLVGHSYVWKYYTTWHQTCAHDTFDEYHKRCEWCDYRDPQTSCTDMNHRGDGLKHRFEYEGWVNGYNYVTGVKPDDCPASCTAAGYRWESSSPCGYGHGNPPWGRPPYCTLVAHRKVSVPAVGHSWGPWTVNRIILQPQGSNPGVIEYIRTCSRCLISEYRMENFYDTAPPVITINPVSSDWVNKLDITASVSDTGGSGLKTLSWIFSSSAAKPQSGWQSLDITPPGVNWHQHKLLADADGLWYLHFQATDLCLNASYKSAGVYKIDGTPPAVTCTKKSGPEDSLKLLVESSDNLSGIDRIEYRFSDSASRPAAGWLTSGSASFEAVYGNFSTDAYLHTETYDNAGNKTYKVFGPYTPDKVEITGVAIKGSWNHWRGQVDMFGKRLANQPHRFLGLEKVRITVDTTGFAEKVTVRFSPELESMRYTDSNGVVYKYEEKTGRYIKFPEDTTFNLDSTQKDNRLSWEYILPLAPSTINWSDVRIRNCYKMTITAYKGGKTDIYQVDDIDMTGNIYDLTYIQPLR